MLVKEKSEKNLMIDKSQFNFDKKLGFLNKIGVYGYDEFEDIIMSALVTEDPLLLIGSTGTGKTYLLNNLSIALGLKHRHYNASLISFDDLVGFPYPDEQKQGIKYLQTEYTVWDAQSILLDEISRCKPENQNKLFSILYEKKIQGMEMKNLIYRWAAMNPCNNSQDLTDIYTGSQPLDMALADRFSLFIESKDWSELNQEEKELIGKPLDKEIDESVKKELKENLNLWKKEFALLSKKDLKEINQYSIVVADALNSAAIRFSPRRVKQLARNLTALTAVKNKIEQEKFLTVLKCSLPHKCWGFYPPEDKILAAHNFACKGLKSKRSSWSMSFLTEKSLPKKIEIFLDKCKDPEEGSEVIMTFLEKAPKVVSYAFAFAVYPLAAIGKLNIDSEAVDRLGELAMSLYKVDKRVTYDALIVPPCPQQPLSGVDYQDVWNYCRKIKDPKRRKIAKQFLSACLVEKIDLKEAFAIEPELYKCIQIIKGREKI